MSRSFKHRPYYKDCVKSSKQRKRYANRIFRRSTAIDLGSGKSMIHRRYTNSWDIHDYILRWSRKDAIDSYNREEARAAIVGVPLEEYGWHAQYKTVDEFLQKVWCKGVYRK